MKAQYFQANFRIARKSKKNMVLAVLLILCMIFSVLVVEEQKINDGYRQWRDYNESVHVNADYFSSNLLRKKDYKQTFNNLNKQAEYLAGVQNGEMFDSAQDYLQNSKKLVQTMLAGYQNNYRGASTLNVPPKYQLWQKLVVYDYLYQNHLAIVMNSKESSTYLIYVLSLIGMFLFFYILFIASDSWMINLLHPTLLKNIPYQIRDEVKSKFIINLVLTLIPLVIGMLGSYLFAGFKNGFNSLNYPAVLYFTRISAVPLWFYCLLYLAYAVVLVIFVTSLAFLLNQLTHSVYLTIFIATLVYSISFLPGSIVKYLFFLPSVYLNISNVLDGTVSSQAIVPTNLITGMLVLLVWTVVLIMWFRHLVNQGGVKK
ncbi:hypothetical protein [Lactobacillus crispatus]|jgi:hypothetical protein|uniref:ABC transporter permease n=1 Tax=Lactobacillus crispatus TaxID=47770 RepID=A0A135ZDW1_9LACO|nr:hypothetical protein [Lactobacillus crispatus]STX17008.1 ABC-2 family transporter protein [Lactobacillus acidophilus]EEJ70286.1 hypothetical protein HMPREF0506_0641 [Lactobacillus crispatus JV-V01]EEU28806.1 hypothetical protein HMPREF0507_00421 [Lactobacillus crispatus MV-1A-US]KWU06019.1 hypothetical protein AEL96_05570 [Lactobacillus crispatus]KXI19745.1 hypothetical protein HMPREF3209_00990 [Lactobacillus crispatus]